jgi:PAS domain S-box-containing protein
MEQKCPPLSPREREIVNLAAGGHTDAGIASKLGISTPTVGTYWNRVRAKMGAYSRTELVAKILLAESQRTVEALTAEFEALLEEARLASVPWKELVMNSRDAFLLIDLGGRIVDANSPAAVLFGYDLDELKGMAVKSLVPFEKREEHEHHVLDFVSAPPSSKKMGRHVGTNALRKDGSEVLIAADLKSFEVDGEQRAAWVARPVVQDVMDLAG